MLDEMPRLKVKFCRAGGPGISVQDLEWLDSKLKAFLADGSW